MGSDGKGLNGRFDVSDAFEKGHVMSVIICNRGWVPVKHMICINLQLEIFSECNERLVSINKSFQSGLEQLPKRGRRERQPAQQLALNEATETGIDRRLLQTFCIWKDSDMQTQLCSIDLIFRG